MFALPAGDSIDVDKFHGSENLLDVLEHAGVSVLWRDNNSDSKGVARNTPFEDFRNADLNPDCDIECRDPGMLAGLDQFVDSIKAGDILVVLHQMGNHGPAYSRRYPPTFEVFTPVCDSNQLEQCSLEAINNSYDNAILYTDYFLTSTIEFLRSYDDRFETALFYISDHGESLGEHGLYLHGLPNLVAPREQREVASVMWFGSNFKVEPGKVIAQSADPLTHANVFHTVLGMFEVQTAIYRRDMDILRDARK
jgi:lipid A ethanolaminephosphotransferase